MLDSLTTVILLVDSVLDTCVAEAGTDAELLTVVAPFAPSKLVKSPSSA